MPGAWLAPQETGTRGHRRRDSSQHASRILPHRGCGAKSSKGASRWNMEGVKDPLGRQCCTLGRAEEETEEAGGLWVRGSG